MTATFGRHFEVVGDDGQILQAVRRGKRHDVACGDRVVYVRSAEGQAVIESVLPRTTLLFRADATRQKLLAANLTQAIIVVAPSPPYDDELLTRCLAGAAAAGLRTLIVLNKMDLGESAQHARRELGYYVDCGYPLLALTARDDVTPLLPWLQDQMSLFVGQSGMGKSTLVNGLTGSGSARTGAISLALNAGRHTTTHARLYPLTAIAGESAGIIDSPGLQDFGLHHLGARDLEQAFPEFSTCIGQCRFANCLHRHEPGCAFKASAEGDIRRLRRLNYLTRLLPLR